MDSWRRRKGDNYNHEVTRTRSYNKKPPLGTWQPTVPSWEKKFCSSIGSVPWRKVLEAKRFMHLYDNVVKWNDSAGEEAFYNAKNRFYAKIHSLPCDVSLPDPDIYIDEIDWDSKIDPELLLDLESEAGVLDDDEKDENVVVFGNSLLSNQGFSSTGWGISEEELKRAASTGWGESEEELKRVVPTGWGESEEELKRPANLSLQNNGYPSDCNYGQSNGAVEGNGWGNFGNKIDGAMGNSGWGDGWNSGGGVGWNNSWGWNQHENSSYGSGYVKHGNTNGNWGAWDVNNGKRESTGRYMSRHTTSRFRGDDHQRNHSWRNGNGIRG